MSLTSWLLSFYTRPYRRHFPRLPLLFFTLLSIALLPATRLHYVEGLAPTLMPKKPRNLKCDFGTISLRDFVITSDLDILINAVHPYRSLFTNFTQTVTCAQNSKYYLNFWNVCFSSLHLWYLKFGNRIPLFSLCFLTIFHLTPK